MKRQLSIYVRRKDGIYVIPYGVTTQGFTVLTEPFEHLPIGSSGEDIWLAVTRVLENANQKVPHPDSWDQETVWYRRAGVKTWRQFASKCEAISVHETDHEYIFNNLETERGGFVGRRETKLGVSKTSSQKEILAAFTRCFEAAVGKGSK